MASLRLHQVLPRQPVRRLRRHRHLRHLLGRGSYPYPKSCNAACKQSSRETAWNNTLNGTFGLNFWADFARSKGKPLTLPEWGLWERPDGHGGGDNKYYIQQMFDFINDPSNNVGYHSYFEVNVGSSGSHMLETHTSAGSLFKKLLG